MEVLNGRVAVDDVEGIGGGTADMQTVGDEHWEVGIQS